MLPFRAAVLGAVARVREQYTWDLTATPVQRDDAAKVPLWLFVLRALIVLHHLPTCLPADSRVASELRAHHRPACSCCAAGALPLLLLLLLLLLR